MAFSDATCQFLCLSGTTSMGGTYKEESKEADDAVPEVVITRTTSQIQLMYLVSRPDCNSYQYRRM